MAPCLLRLMRREKLLIVGITWLMFLCVAYFIPVHIETGSNYIVEDTLLGIVIFYSPLVLGLYVLLGIALVAAGSGVRVEFW